MKTDLSAYNNDWFKPGSAVKRVIWYFVNAVFFKSSLFAVYGLKVFLLRLFGARIGTGVLIKPNVNIKYPWLLRISDHVWIGEEVWIDNLAPVSIGSHVCISQGSFLLCGNHDFTKTAFDLTVAPITIEDGVWLGAKSIICGGSICRSHAVLTAGSLCAGVLEAYSIYQGNPAQRLKSRTIAD